jgi:hypothetical protein
VGLEPVQLMSFTGYRSAVAGRIARHINGVALLRMRAPSQIPNSNPGAFK